MAPCLELRKFPQPHTPTISTPSAPSTYIHWYSTRYSTDYNIHLYLYYIFIYITSQNNCNGMCGARQRLFNL